MRHNFAHPKEQNHLMEEQTKPAETNDAKSTNEVALELMKFIANSTGYGKGSQAVGFTGKGARTPEEQADALLELFDRCRKVVRKED